MPFALRFPWLPPTSLKSFGFSAVIAPLVNPFRDPAQVAAEAHRAQLIAALKEAAPHMRWDDGEEACAPVCPPPRAWRLTLLHSTPPVREEAACLPRGEAVRRRRG